MGHSSSAIFGNHYLNPIVRIDVPNLFLSQPTQDQFLHDMTHMRVAVDPNVPHYLPPTISERIEKNPDLVKLKMDLDEISDKIDGSADSACIESLRAEMTTVQGLIRSRRRHYSREALRTLQQAYFATRDGELLQQELSKLDSSDPNLEHSLKASLALPERARLADLFAANRISSSTPQHRKRMVEVVKTMTDLCSRSEDVKSRQKAQLTLLTKAASPTCTLETEVAEEYPIQCSGLQCLFCLGKVLLAHVDRQKSFATRQKLSDHVDNHLSRCDWNNGVQCPHPACENVRLRNPPHFKNHALQTHGCELRP
jgi:hypothetical protein